MTYYPPLLHLKVRLLMLSRSDSIHQAYNTKPWNLWIRLPDWQWCLIMKCTAWTSVKVTVISKTCIMCI